MKVLQLILNLNKKMMIDFYLDNQFYDYFHRIIFHLLKLKMKILLDLMKIFDEFVQLLLKIIQMTNHLLLLQVLVELFKKKK
jgi:hypothetical protein